MDFRQIPLEKILFLDIETVPMFADYEQLPDRWKKLWDKKAQYLPNPEEQTQAQLYERAGIYAEFGKIVAIALGFITKDRKLRIKSIYGDNEKCILLNLKNILDKHYSDGKSYLCAHNGKEFDFPFIARRMLVNNIKIPSILDTHGKKPWEVQHLDTMELWKFGDKKHFTSLELLATLFGLPSPKSEIDGSQIKDLYWQHKALEQIAQYCEKDTITVAQLLLKFRGEPPIEPENIQITQRQRCD